MAQDSSPHSARLRQIRQVAQDQFGYEVLRPGQAEAIAALLSGQDTLAVLPTGSGKSAIYQIAAVMLPGPTVVVSPLVALQQDQVTTLADQAVGGAAQVNAGVGERDREETFAALESGDLEFIFLAPEQFNRPETLERLQAARPSLFVIDEAHCVSEWGHDFRPDYLRLGTIIEALGHPTVLALTATAAPPVREEIIERLGMREAKQVIQGFDRPNLWLSVHRFEDTRTKQQALLKQVERLKKPGIVYVATRKQAEELARELGDRGIQAVFYHAGMKGGDREAAQTAFMADEAEVMVATTAFGMGIDKPNVRFVFHYHISESVDSYYQEIGRAGRDGQLAMATLFYDADDLKLRQFLASGGQLDAEQVAQVASVVQQQEEPVKPKELKDSTDLSQTKLTQALSHLEQEGIVEFLPTGEVVAAEAEQTVESAVTAAVEAQERYQQWERSRLAMIQGYAETRDCRRKYILNYFGEDYPQPCNLCDNCKAGNTLEAENQEQPFPLNSQVRHDSWGEGQVMRYEGDKIVVLFESMGYRTLSIDLATKGLLELISSP